MDPVQRPGTARRKSALSRVRTFATVLAFHSITGKFLLWVVPVTVICFVSVVAVYQWLDYRAGYERIGERLQLIAASQPLILGEAVAARNHQMVGLIVASAISDPLISGIAVYDADNQPIDVFGEGFAESTELTRRSSIRWFEGDGFVKVGSVVVVGTEDRLLKQIKRSVVYQTSVAVVLLAIALLVAHFTHRRTIGIPVQRLLAETRAVEQGRPPTAVEWSSEDEMGRVIAAYNVMQASQAAAQQQLQKAHEETALVNRTLEQRVVERTRDLEAEIRERRRIEIALRIAIGEADEANRAKTEFL